MTETRYNGWSNRETWVVSLWLDSERGSSEYWQEQVARHRQAAPTCKQVEEGTWNAERAAEFNLADQLEEEVTGAQPLPRPTLYSELLAAALYRVNWHEIARHWLADLPEEENEGEDEEQEQEGETFGPVISAYTRAQAIEDGVLIDVSAMAQEAGISVPVALTAGVWERFVKVPEGVEGQDENGRLWAVLNMFYCAARRELKDDTVLFDVLVKTDNTAPRPLALKAVYGPGDTTDPVITIMLPYED